MTNQDSRQAKRVIRQGRELVDRLNDMIEELQSAGNDGNDGYDWRAIMKYLLLFEYELALAMWFVQTSIRAREDQE